MAEGPAERTLQKLEQESSGVEVSLTDLAELASDLHPARVKWYLIGSHLKIDVGDLSAIRAEFPDLNLQLHELLRIWLSRLGPRTVEDLIRALMKPNVNEPQLALALQQKYNCAFPPPTSDECRSLLTVRQAKAMSQMLRTAFKSLVSLMHIELERQFADKKVSQFITEFITDLPISPKSTKKKFFPNTDKLSKISSFEKLFIFLSEYWDYFNCNLLHSIVHGYGSEEAQQQMEQYCVDLKSFLQRTTLRVYWAFDPLLMRTCAPYGWRRVVTKLGITADSTLEEVAKIRHKVTSEFQLQEFALILEDIVEGSVRVTWLVPCSLVEVLLCGLTPTFLNELLIKDISFTDVFSMPPAAACLTRPRTSIVSLSEEPNKRDLMKVARRLSSWHSDLIALGFVLGLSANDIHRIESTSYDHYRYMNLFEAWRDKASYPYTWKTLVRALERIGEHEVAYELRDELLSQGMLEW